MEDQLSPELVEFCEDQLLPELTDWKLQHFQHVESGLSASQTERLSLNN